MSAATATIIGGAIAAGGAIGAAEIQSHAAGKAADAQTAAATKSNTRLDPYAQAGYGAISNLQGLVGRPAGGASMAGALSATPSQTPSSTVPQSGMVTVRAPTGEVQTVPFSQSGYWQSKGATIV